ncbi:hypothetical protein MSP8887_00497 [Marinomonas spartinae]|uniref:Sodium Bile acid symporter family protein n=1 Tax=Marinomonas spartinae TaxID=1792290 RepID=A0A1A8TJH0_9GAMM|nr:hypothetical protein [Marinomonas spartinae]SBS26781.1 hypothetical protein MSP8887_00497 [Marinomonas spartinae]SBS32990.1 hypothetical protein MSP8886_02624 [Marinomonas spartinae]
MFAFLIRHSLVFMFLSAVLGFVLPDLSSHFFVFLPYILFCLMTLTLLGIRQNELLRRLKKVSVWGYAFVHSAVYMLLVGCIANLFHLDKSLQLAMVSVAATGSLFATPAIVRALGFDSIEAMAMTIASTLLLPAAIFVTLLAYHPGHISLDLTSYMLRLVIFIFGPMFFSYLIHKAIQRDTLNTILNRISPYTILFVLAFPFGLVGSFRQLFDRNPHNALIYLVIAILLCCLFFIISYWVYRKSGKEFALTAAITSGNRNVLLTYTIAGGLLGPAFLPLAGALQIPTSLLPVVTRYLSRRIG